LEEKLKYVKNDFRIIYILEQSNNTNLINNNYILKKILINIHIENNNINAFKKHYLISK
jgi:hypothetical protein